MLFCFNAGEIFDIAIEIKANGKAFYEKARERVDDPEVRKLFEKLARLEEEHCRELAVLKAELPGTLQTPNVADLDDQLDAYIKSLAGQHAQRGLGDQVGRIATQDEALQLALQFEKDSVIFFLGMLDATCEGKAREVIQRLVQEEQHHLKDVSLLMKKKAD